MIVDIFLHPAIPVFIGSILIFFSKEKSNLISVAALLVSLYVLLFFSDHKDLIYTLSSSNLGNETHLSLHYYSYSKLGFLFCLVYLIIGILGKLSTENSKRTPRRTASTASALMIGLTLISLANVITTSFKAQAESVVSEVVKADYQISAAQVFVSPGIPTGLSDELIALDEVTKLSRSRATIVGFEDRPLILGAVDEDIFDLIKTENIAGSKEEFLKPNAMGVLKQKAERDNLGIGDEIILTIPEEGKRTFTIEYIFDWTTPPPAEFFLLLENYSFFSEESLDTEIYFNVKEKNESTQAKLDQIVSDYPGAKLRDQDGLVEEANTQIQQLLNVIYGFLSISILITFPLSPIAAATSFNTGCIELDTSSSLL